MGNQKYKVESRTEREQEDDVALSNILDLAPYLHHAPPPTTCTDWAC